MAILIGFSTTGSSSQGTYRRAEPADRLTQLHVVLRAIGEQPTAAHGVAGQAPYRDIKAFA
jgi:hypothetical protein